MRIAFICSKYRNNPTFNTRQAIKFCLRATKKNYIPICPHLYFTQFLADDNPEQRKLGMKMGKQLMRICDEMWVFEKYGVSEGMEQEVEYWKRKYPKKEIKYFK